MTSNDDILKGIKEINEHLTRMQFMILYTWILAAMLAIGVMAVMSGSLIVLIASLIVIIYLSKITMKKISKAFKKAMKEFEEVKNK